MPPVPSSAPATPSDVEATPTGDRTAAPSRSATPGTPSAIPTPSATGTPSATPSSDKQVHGLCRAWLAKKPDQREKALRTPAFQRLVTAAGDPAQVEAYCRRLVPEATPSRPVSATPSQAATTRRTPK
ncbi:hypothetical protein GCM10027614_11150 [Micromonospora vulcania]